MTSHERTSRRFGHRVLLYGGAAGLWAILLLWAWNTLAVELFAAPPMGFRHAVAAETLIALPLVMLAAFVRRGHRRDPVPGAA